MAAKGPKPKPFWARVDKTEDCWVWKGARSGGRSRFYGEVRISGRRYSAHRYSWILAYGEIPDGLWVLHKCDNPPCVRPDHLFLGTLADNNRDRHAKGRSKTPFIGASHPMRKVSDTDKLKIRSLRLAGVPRAQVAKMFGIEGHTVTRAFRALGLSGSKLAATDVERIRDQALMGEVHKDIAERFGIAPGYVRHVVTGKVWGNV